MAKKLVLAGAGHAHMTVMARLDEITSKGHEAVVIGPGSRHYYSGMGPGMLGGTYTALDISFPVKRIVESGGGLFIEDKVKSVDPEARRIITEDCRSVDYDVVSFNTGSYVPKSVVKPEAMQVYWVKPIENLGLGRSRILEIARQREVRIGVVGGGPGGLEVAGNAWAAARETGGKGATVRVYAGKAFLNKAPASVERLARKEFNRRGIEIVEGAYVSEVDTGKVLLKDGRSFEDDVIFIAMGVKPRPFFEPFGIPAGPDGGLLTNKYLQSSKYPEIFGGGDCIYFEDQPLDKVGVYAVRENPVLFANLTASLEGGELTPFDPGGKYLLIYNLGGGKGVFHKNGVVFSGKLAFFLKDYIDRRFMREFQP